MNGWGFFMIVLLLAAAGLGAVVYNELGHAQDTLKVASEVQIKQAKTIKEQGQTIDQLNAQIASLVQDKDTLGRELEQKTADLQKAQETATRLQNENSGLFSLNAELNAEKIRLAQANAALTNEKASLEQAKAQLVGEKTNQEKIIAAEETERKRLVDENQNLRALANSYQIPLTGGNTIARPTATLEPTSQPGDTSGTSVPWGLVGGVGGVVVIGAVVGGKVLHDTRKAAASPAKRAPAGPNLLHITVTREEAELLRRNRLSR